MVRRDRTDEPRFILADTIAEAVLAWQQDADEYDEPKIVHRIAEGRQILIAGQPEPEDQEEPTDD
jgi:hypothetical protein